MKQYIGTKIIHAEPARRYWFENGEKLVVPDSEENPERIKQAAARESGYKVVYSPDGYESWSPKDVFEEAYRETTGMPFGLAIEAMKMGRAVAREGWNGKEMFLYYVPANEYAVTTEIARSYFGDTVPYGAYIAMKTMQGNVVPWLASQTDMLADDWQIVE